MSEIFDPSVQPQKPEQKVADHPAVQKLLADLGAALKTQFFIVGSGTPEQEEEYRRFLETHQRDRRATMERVSLENAPSAETLSLLAKCL